MAQPLSAIETWGQAKYLRPVWTPHTGLRALGEVAAAMHREFSQHVAREEAPCGFFAFVVAAAPRYEPLIELMRLDHRRLGRSLATLRMKILRAEPSQLQGLSRECDALATEIVQHDELEWEILRDTFE